MRFTRTKRDFDPAVLRAQFPALNQEVRGKPLVYLDSAATSHRPEAVLRALNQFSIKDNANVHRGVHALSERATLGYEHARRAVAEFLGAESAKEIVFTRGTTEAINLVAWSWGRANLRPGDVILASQLEHHSNLVPWQLVAEVTGAVVRPIPVLDDGQLDLDALDALLDERVRMVAIAHVSNALGTVIPVRSVVARAHAAGALVLVDGAQAVAHVPVDVRALGCDFYAISAHKVYGPTGIGCLWGRRELLADMPPWQGGGDMIRVVRFDGSTFAAPPARFEAGTPNIAGAIGFGAAVEWLSAQDRGAIWAHETALLERATRGLEALDGVRIIGTAPHKEAVISFVVDGVHPHDLGTALDLAGVAVRAGHHCAQPAMRRFGVPSTTRASLAAYTSTADIDTLVSALTCALKVLR